MIGNSQHKDLILKKILYIVYIEALSSSDIKRFHSETVIFPCNTTPGMGQGVACIISNQRQLLASGFGSTLSSIHAKQTITTILTFTSSSPSDGNFPQHIMKRNQNMK